MFQSEKLSVSVDFTEETRKSLAYVLSFATEIGAQFIVLQVMERKAERYSLIFPVALLEKWPFAGKSVPTIPLSALPQDKSADLAGVIDRIVKTKRQRWIKRHSVADSPVKILAATFRDDKIDMVIFELGGRLPFPHRLAVELLMGIKSLPYPVLLTGPNGKQEKEPIGPLRLDNPTGRKTPPRRPGWSDLRVAGR
jgi:hypothetical protein